MSTTSFDGRESRTSRDYSERVNLLFSKNILMFVSMVRNVNNIPHGTVSEVTTSSHSSHKDTEMHH